MSNAGFTVSDAVSDIDTGLFSNFSLSSTVAGAQLPAWIGAVDTTWSNASNWVNGVPGATTGTTSTGTAIFDGSPNNLQPVVDLNRNLQNITFTSYNVGAVTLGTVGGNSLLLTSGGAISVDTSVVNSQKVNAPLILEGAGGTYAITNNSAASNVTLSIGGQVSGGAAGTTVLTLNGSNTGANIVSGAIVDGSATHLAVNKSGVGAWTLSAANTYSGATTISGGTLNIPAGSSLGNTAISVSNATLAVLPGAGSISAGTGGNGPAGASLAISVGGVFSMVDGAVGTFNVQQQNSFASPGLSLNSATLNFDLGTSAADEILLSSVGTASVGGTNSIGITTLGSSIGSGPFTLISAPGGGLTGTFQFTGGTTSKYVNLNNTYYQLSLNDTSTALSLSVVPLSYFVLDTFNVPSPTTYSAHSPDINLPRPGGFYTGQCGNNSIQPGNGTIGQNNGEGCRFRVPAAIPSRQR